MRAELIKEIFESKSQKQFSAERVPELLKEKEQYFANPKVTFYRYKNRKYSVFSSGDYDKYIAFKTKKKTKKSLENTLNKSVTDSEVNQAQFDQGFVPEPVVSEQIKRSIRLQEELRDFAQGSKKIVDSLLQSISAESDQKKRRWVQKTVNYYRNILELVKNPLSSYNVREIANQIHDFAFFLATENQYHLLGNRFDEALSIYQRLRREQRHLVEDIEQGLITGEEANIDVLQLKEQMAKDDESIAAILLSIARVRLDSVDKDKAKEALDQAKGLAGKQTLVRGQICHLESILACLNCDTDAAISLINEACGIVSALKLEESGEGLAIMASKADLLQRTGDTEGAVTLYETLLSTSCDNEEACEVQTSAHLNLAILNLSAGQIDEADKNVSEALDGFEKLYTKEPDRILPSLLNAKYIKGLVLAHRGDINESISMMESATDLVPDNRPDLYALCGTELLEIYVTLRDILSTIGENHKSTLYSTKAKDLLPKIESFLPENALDGIKNRL
ncbi:MAG: hypothetical protein IKX20_06635 [Paludibacteraceae bacterium]|nr:hypothetical protein [Paludibacteraceae bacterium]